jgi:hypothetical protein
MKIKQCPDGYMTCRKAEAGGDWCQGRCVADDPRTDASMLREMALTLEMLLKARPVLGSFMGPYNTLGNLRNELNQHVQRMAP